MTGGDPNGWRSGYAEDRAAEGWGSDRPTLFDFARGFAIGFALAFAPLYAVTEVLVR